MFEYVNGTLDETGTEHAVLDVGGIGYLVFAPQSTLAALPAKGERVKLFTYHYVREDMEKLFGFLTKGEREAFLRLLDISQVGPKAALAVLSGMSVRDLALAVHMGDAARFKTISGIGPKTAQRIVLELKGKLDPSLLASIPPSQRNAKKAAAQTFPAREDAYAALIALGYSESQVLAALARVEETVTSDSTAEAWIRSALKVV